MTPEQKAFRREVLEEAAKVADEAALSARASIDRNDARTTSGTSVFVGYTFAKTEAESIAKRIRALAASQPAPAADTGQAVVVAPRIPTDRMWSGLARDIVQWWGFERPTGRKLHDHLHALGRDIPDWLRAELPPVDHVPTKGDVAVAIYRAMLEDAPAHPDPLDGGHVTDEMVEAAYECGTDLRWSGSRSNFRDVLEAALRQKEPSL